MGYETYQIAPANDNKVCSICEALRNKEFQLKDRQPGTNYPPLHPWCRCTVFVEVDDEGDELTNEELEELEFISNDIEQTKQKYSKIKNDLEDTNIPAL